MFKKLYPYEYVESVFTIDYNQLYKKGYKAIIFDIDNTLVPHGKDATKEVEELFENLHNIGFKTLLLSNNCEERIKKFIKNIDTLYICDAEKPKTHNYIKAIEKLNINKKEVIYIGDQIFTDIYGANKSGIDNILVKYIGYYTETKIGIKRNIEKIIIKLYGMRKKYQNRIGNIEKQMKNKGENKGVNKMQEKEKRLFCEINPLCFKISLLKETCKRHLQNLLSKEKFAKTKKDEKISNIVSNYSSKLIKTGKGIDIKLQENKATNIKIASEKINGIIIHPGEVFSFWKIVGKTTKRKGYKDGRVIIGNKLQPGIGGGLCNLGNTIHLLVLHSPLDVIEFHNHSDALAPDEGKRVPFSTGTSISYNNLDYRFKNNTNQDIQICVWCEDGKLFGELRSQEEFPWKYELIEENHHFEKEKDKYYRISKIYRQTIEKSTGNVLEKKLVLDNHSEVMYDYDLIPKEQIKI